jgi:hypothetical protein
MAAFLQRLSNARSENDNKFSELVDVMSSAAELAVDEERHRSSTLEMPDLLFGLVVLPSGYSVALDRVSTVSLTNLRGSSSEHLEAEVSSHCLFRRGRFAALIFTLSTQWAS